MLKNEILEVLDLFEKYQISDERQRKIFNDGLYFDYTYGDPDFNHRNQHLNIFGVGMLLKLCLENNIDIDINELIETPYKFENEELIKEIALRQNDYSGSSKKGTQKVIVIR